ncbi:hypothetical protein CDD83_5703 [Cordyceps sp. RAO-2017]|nr:hypothetical protein CDD83_5703 [Cordyceps sp. RAO-2017]
MTAAVCTLCLPSPSLPARYQVPGIHSSLHQLSSLWLPRRARARHRRSSNILPSVEVATSNDVSCAGNGNGNDGSETGKPAAAEERMDYPANMVMLGKRMVLQQPLGSRHVRPQLPDAMEGRARAILSRGLRGYDTYPPTPSRDSTPSSD